MSIYCQIIFNLYCAEVLKHLMIFLTEDFLSVSILTINRVTVTRSYLTLFQHELTNSGSHLPNKNGSFSHLKIAWTFTNRQNTVVYSRFAENLCSHTNTNVSGDSFFSSLPVFNAASLIFHDSRCFVASVNQSKFNITLLFHRKQRNTFENLKNVKCRTCLRCCSV